MTRSNTCTYLLLQTSQARCANICRTLIRCVSTRSFLLRNMARSAALLSGDGNRDPAESFQIHTSFSLPHDCTNFCTISVRSYSPPDPLPASSRVQRDLQRVTRYELGESAFPEPLSLETAADSWRSQEVFHGSLKVYRTDLSRISERWRNDAPVRRFTESDETITVLMEKNGCRITKFLCGLQKLVMALHLRKCARTDTVMAILLKLLFLY